MNRAPPQRRVIVAMWLERSRDQLAQGAARLPAGRAQRCGRRAWAALKPRDQVGRARRRAKKVNHLMEESAGTPR